MDGYIFALIVFVIQITLIIFVYVIAKIINYGRF